MHGFQNLGGPDALETLPFHFMFSLKEGANHMHIQGEISCMQLPIRLSCHSWSPGARSIAGTLTYLVRLWHLATQSSIPIELDLWLSARFQRGKLHVIGSSCHGFSPTIIC